MSSGSDRHDRDSRESVFLYALQVLPSSERPAVEAHLSECASAFRARRCPVMRLHFVGHKMCCDARIAW